MNESAIFSTELFTERMFPIISSTAALAWLTLCDWLSIILSSDSMLDAISLTAPAVSVTLLCWLFIWECMLSMFARISVIALAAAWELSERSFPASMRDSFECLTSPMMFWSFSENLLNPATRIPISSLLEDLILLVRSAFPSAIPIIVSLTMVIGLTIVCAMMNAMRSPMPTETRERRSIAMMFFWRFSRSSRLGPIVTKIHPLSSEIPRAAK